MPISHSRRFIFIHVPKCAGRSIRAGLIRDGDSLEFDGRSSSQDERDRISSAWRNHVTALNIRSLVPQTTWQNYFKFAIVRNPFDRLVSFYHFCIQRAASLNARPILYIPETRVLARARFEDWLRLNVVRRSCFEYVSDIQNRIIVDYVGRLEDFPTPLKIIGEHIGSDLSAIPHINRTRHKNYRYYYSDASKRMVFDRFQADFEHFGYSF